MMKHIAMPTPLSNRLPLHCVGCLLFESNDQSARYGTALGKLIKEHTDALSVMRLAQLNAILSDKACLVYFPGLMVRCRTPYHFEYSFIIYY